MGLTHLDLDVLIGILCLGYTQALRPGVKASLGLALDTTKMNSEGGAPAHKVGASMVFES
jgi:voltage-dependent anion channel protein 2